METVEMKLSWSAAFRIAWAIVIVQAFVGVVGFIVFALILGGLLNELGG